ncbi:MAG: epoxyqueuosine reductase [Deltaproteobacteria bacterium]|nr:epoxyqueuosine reductase [Deltaproteobacteria bacterium]MBW2136531.1 epoxyqueuosine reductase [Deltaproteobacteria bacterium]
MASEENSQSWIESVISDFLDKSPSNTLGGGFKEKAFERFVVGFSSGDDPLFHSYKTYVGPFHWTPHEIFSMTFTELDASPRDLTVITWVLLQKEVTKEDNRKETRYPSERWARARIYGEKANKALRKHVVDTLTKAGFHSLAPQLSPEWSVRESEKYVLASNWSERHAAFASGLGTFGLCDGLITPEGKAMRVGSIVARIQIPSTERPYTSHNEYCLFYTKGLCGKCMERCPVGAISEKGHDKIKCRSYIKIHTEDYVKSRYGFDGYGCGLCQTGVPCESKIPTEHDLE